MYNVHRNFYPQMQRQAYEPGHWIVLLTVQASSFSVNQHILMEMTLHGEESTNSSDEGVS